MEAFRDTRIFTHLSDPSSVKTQFLLSPFVANFTTGKLLTCKRTVFQRLKSTVATQLHKKKSETYRQLKSSGSIFLSVVDSYLDDIDAITKAKLDPVNELDPEFEWISVSALLLLGILKC